jgi:CHASE1-domain containing sensor protein
MLDAFEAGTKWRRRRHVLPILAVACLGVVVALSSWLAVSIWEGRLAKASFANVAGDYAAVLQNGLDQYLAKMIVMRAFYDSSVTVDPDEFDVFTGRILEGETSMMRVTWSPRVTRDERAEFERKAKGQGLANYEIKDWAPDGALAPAPERSDYFPILYSTPAANFPSVLGVDLNAEPARREALQRAQDGDRIATAPKVELHHAAGGDWRGFL